MSGKYVFKEVVMKYIHRLKLYVIFDFLPKLCYLYKRITSYQSYTSYQTIFSVKIVYGTRYQSIRFSLYFPHVITFTVSSLISAALNKHAVFECLHFIQRKSFLCIYHVSLLKLLRKWSTTTKYT